MAIKARSRGTNKKRSASRANDHDRKLLEQASAEAAEGPSRDEVRIHKREYESIVRQLRKLTEEVVAVWAAPEESDGLARILVPLHAARMNLESCATEVQP